MDLPRGPGGPEGRLDEGLFQGKPAAQIRPRGRTHTTISMYFCVSVKGISMYVLCVFTHHYIVSVFKCLCISWLCFCLTLHVLALHSLALAFLTFAILSFACLSKFSFSMS